VKVRSGKTVSGPRTQSVSPLAELVEQEARLALLLIILRILLNSLGKTCIYFEVVEKRA
jgi:hypothetical protein